MEPHVPEMLLTLCTLLDPPKVWGIPSWGTHKLKDQWSYPTCFLKYLLWVVLTLSNTSLECSKCQCFYAGSQRPTCVIESSVVNDILTHILFFIPFNLKAQIKKIFAKELHKDFKDKYCIWSNQSIGSFVALWSGGSKQRTSSTNASQTRTTKRRHLHNCPCKAGCGLGYFSVLLLK